MAIPTLDYAANEPLTAHRIKAIGLHQRNLTLVVIGLFLLQFLTAVSLYFVVLQFAGAVYAVIIVARLLTAFRTTQLRKALTLAGMFVPIANLIILVVLNYQACEILRAAGLRVGYIGVTEEDLNRYGK
jgi:hypothetical protein